MSVSGSCQCGTVRYESDVEPMFAGSCYCLNCQKGSGGGHVTIVAVPEPTLNVTGTTRKFVSKGASGNDVDKVFCPNCGTTLFSLPHAMAGIAMVRAGTLDDPSLVKPTMAIYASRAQAWDLPPAGIQSFAETPPQT